MTAVFARLKFVGIPVALLIASCGDENPPAAIANSDHEAVTGAEQLQEEPLMTQPGPAEIWPQALPEPATLYCDLDGDAVTDTVALTSHSTNGKYGLYIAFGNGEDADSLGFGEEVLDQGFTDLNWVGIFEVAPKRGVYWNNVNDEGEIVGEDEVDEKDKITLKNDGIFIHQSEACGGGVIYFENGKYYWIQQE